MNKGLKRSKVVASLACALMATGVAVSAQAQTGVSEDRVSLPEGPGSLEGVGENVDINTNMGSMTHSVKVEVPQGFPSVTPSLDLSYSSSAGESMLGVGWSMPMPAVERMTFKGLPQYTGSDDFCANGSDQLIRLPGSNPPVYRSRFEKGFVRYTWMDEGDGTEGYWIGEMPDGSKAYFGATSDGTLVPEARVGQSEGTFRYHMVEKVDVHGHREVWSYQKFGNYALPVSVGYVFVDDAPTYEVELSYEERRDETEVAYISDGAPGFNLLLTQRLTRMDIKSRGVTIRSYVLNYEPYADAGGFTRLNRVETLGARGNLYPIVFDFEYSQALGGQCDGQDCERPFMMDMGNLGVNVGVGRTTLIDINGDALPDVVDASFDGPHRFFINVANVDGTAQFAAEPIESASGTRSSHPLGNATVQTLDVNGDGFSDLVNAGTGQVLINTGQGDWDANTSAVASDNIATALNEDFNPAEGGLQALRFIDFNNDKRIDLMRATRAATVFFENKGERGFEVLNDFEEIEAGFEEDNLQLADMNGDGNLDVVRVQLGSISYRLNFGWGKWGDWVDITGLPIGEGQLETAELEDINGDALADLVVVQGASVTYALNNNSTDFDAPITLDSADVEGDIPQRDATTTVMYADMNANGSSDVVWITAQGEVRVLDLFPVRPNLMTRITNGIGMVTDIEYTTAAREMARDGGVDAWRYKLPSPMNIVKQRDQYDLLTNLHEITRYDYHDGFYDGVEKQFRGFERVETTLIGDETVEEGFTREVYDVGAEDEYRNGLLLSSMVASDGRELLETTHIYEDCPVAEIVDGTAEDIRHICKTSTRSIIKEDADEAEWRHTLKTIAYDGYGNVTLDADLGVVGTDNGGAACASCGDRGPDDFGAPCSAQCVGDEMFTRTEFVPTDSTNGRWIINAPFRVQTYGREGSPLTTETLTYYDGNAFEGLPLGNLDKANPTRTTMRISADSDDVIQKTRHRFDDHGNIVEVLDPLGEADGTTHRRVFTYDTENLRVVRADIFVEDKEGNPYTLSRILEFEPLFDKVSFAIDWFIERNGMVESEERTFSYEYDEFARMSARFLPGNTTAEPDEAFEYDLQSPASRIITHKRSQIGQEFDLESVDCIDGRGRSYQKRTRVAQGSYQIEGLTLFNIQSLPIKLFQPYMSDSPECDTSAPEGVLSETMRYDALYRQIEHVQPDGDIYGTASVNRIAYAPLAVIQFDAEDNNPNGPHINTPTITRSNGLGNTIAIERVLEANGAPAVVQVRYDSLHRVTGYIDPGQNVKEQYFDLLERVTRIVDPNSANDTTFEYDDASNLVRQTDDRGIVTVNEYDGLNRKIATYDQADEQGTLIELIYDIAPDCERCEHIAGKTAIISYPGINGERIVDRSSYDQRNRLVFTSRTFNGIEMPFEMVYDNANRVLSMTPPDGNTIEKTYDDAGRLIGVTGLLDAIHYDERNKVAGMNCTDGTSSTISYDDLMRPTRITVDGAGGTLQGFGYEFDREGNLLSLEDLAQAPNRPNYTAQYDYDAWYRTVGMTYGQELETLSFSFNDLGNITSITSSLGAQSNAHVGAMLYDSFAPNAITEAGGKIIGYDASGNVTERGEQTYTWDFMNRMTQAQRGDEVIANFVYGPAQSRVAKIEGDAQTLYASKTFEVRNGISSLYIKVGRHRAVRIESDALATSLYEDLNNDDQISAADAFLAQEGGQQEAIGEVLLSSVRRLLMETGPDNGITFLHNDHLGNLTLATGLMDEEQVVLGQRNFTPLGQERADGFGYVDEYGFTGQELDRSTGLIHFDWRYLDPHTGRWLSIDPAFATTSGDNIIKMGESTAGYAYVAGNFINTFDPTGLEGEGTNKTKESHNRGNYHSTQSVSKKKQKAKLARRKQKSRLEKQFFARERFDTQSKIDIGVLINTAILYKANSKSNSPSKFQIWKYKSTVKKELKNAIRDLETPLVTNKPPYVESSLTLGSAGARELHSFFGSKVDELRLNSVNLDFALGLGRYEVILDKTNTNTKPQHQSKVSNNYSGLINSNNKD